MSLLIMTKIPCNFVARYGYYSYLSTIVETDTFQFLANYNVAIILIIIFSVVIIIYNTSFFLDSLTIKR